MEQGAQQPVGGSTSAASHATPSSHGAAHLPPPGPQASTQVFSAIPAIWHDGKTAAAHSVFLRLRAHTGELGIFASTSAPEPLAIWLIAKTELTAPDSPILPTRLALTPDDGQRLILEPAATHLFQTWHASTRMNTHQARARTWFFGTLAVWGFCVALYLASPLLFQLAATVIPQSWEEDIGKSSLDNILKVLTLSKSSTTMRSFSGKEELDSLMLRLTQVGDTQGYTFSVTVLNADFVNAFALPGGYMMVTTALIRGCTTPDELAAVLAHEMTHVTKRHGTARMLRVYTWSFLARMFGASDSAAGKLGEVLVLAMNSDFDRDQEREADALGMARLVQANITPIGMADFFARLAKEHPEEKYDIFSYFASHPALEERRATIIAEHKKLTHSNFTPALSSAEWQRLHAAALAATPKKPKATPKEAPGAPAGTSKDTPNNTDAPQKSSPKKPDSLPLPPPVKPRPSEKFPDASGGDRG